MSIVLVSRDLMLTSKLEGAARVVGETLKVVATGEGALDAAADCRVMVVDLEVPGLEIASFIDEAKHQQEIPVIAYAPHVRTEKLAAAREAGCDLVVSRGQIMSNVESILRRFL